MQQYRLPTHLLDWSFSPLVAAYFAVEQSGGAEVVGDVCVWALAPAALNESQGFEPLLYPLSAKSLRPLLRPAKKGNDTTDKIVAAMAVEADPRMQMQQGAFTVHSSSTPLNLLADSDKWLRRFTVPAKCVSTLRPRTPTAGLPCRLPLPRSRVAFKRTETAYPSGQSLIQTKTRFLTTLDWE